jgi:hypothetical protein
LSYLLVAYADDVCLICDAGQEHAAINDATELFGEIGLTLNLDKCQILSEHPEEGIEFLSQIFTPEAQPLSPALQLKLEKMKKQLFSVDIPNHQRLLMFRQVIVNSINYGPLLDAADSVAGYQVLDKLLAEILEQILKTGKPIEDIINFATTSLQNGGCSYIFPGVFYQLMREAVVEMRKPNGANIFHKLLSDMRKKESPSPETPKVGYILNSYVNLSDDAFAYVSGSIFAPD